MPTKVRGEDTYHGVDSPILTLSDNVFDLVVASDDWEMASPQLWFFEIPDSTGGEDQNYIELVSNHLTLDAVHVLTVQEAYHTSTSDSSIDLSKSWLLWTSWPDGPKTPFFTLDADTQEEIHSDTTGYTPQIELTDMRPGSRMDEGKTPDIRCSGTVSVPILMTVTGRLPVIEGDSRTGARSDKTGRTPVLELTAQSENTLGSLSKTIPGLTLDAELTTPVVMTVDGKVPALTVDATFSYKHLMELAANIPIPKLTGAMGIGGIGTLDRNIPDIRISATGHTDTMEVAGYVPLPYLSIGSSGAPGGVGDPVGQPGTIVNESRFTGYVLRHAR
jgi:hypothetical protein